MQNYGLGGHYALHYDYFVENSVIIILKGLCILVFFMCFLFLILDNIKLQNSNWTRKSNRNLDVYSKKNEKFKLKLNS
jgi:uncharacterized membrane protein